MLVLPFLAAAASVAQLVASAPTPAKAEDALTIFEADVTSVEHNHLDKRRTYSCASTTDCKRNGFPIPTGGYTGCNKKRGICVLGCNSGYTLSGSTCKRNGGSSSSSSGSSSNVACSSSSQCKTGAFAIPANGYAGCNKARGNSGYVQSGSSCVKKAGASSSNVQLATSSSSDALSSAGINSFLGTNTNAILSWYNTNSGTDSTNGRGWCEWNYNNNIPGFAPSLNTMLANFGYDSVKAKEAYCGLEAVVTTANGKSMTMYIVDAFDDSWVRTPSSLDLIHGAFNKLWGGSTDNKNDVFTGASWRLTGNRKNEYRYKSPYYQ
ncbi:hypothetical protein JCM11251_002554 [Rhodosporidiobolus azoricus]